MNKSSSSSQGALVNEASVKTNNYCSVLSILIGLGQSLILPKEVRKASPEEISSQAMLSS